MCGKKIIVFICFFLSVFLTYSNESDSLHIKLASSKEDSSKADILFKLAKLYMNTDVDSLSKYTQAAKELSDRIDYTFGKILSTYYLGVIATYSGKMDQVPGYLLSAISMLDGKSANREKGLFSKITKGYGTYLQSLGEIDSALYYYKLSLATKKELGDSAGMAVSLCDIGELYYRIGSIKEAIAYLEPAVRIAEATKDTSRIASSYYYISRPLYDMGYMYLAIEYIKKSISLYERTSNIVGRAASYEQLAGFYIEGTHNYEGAREALIKAHELYKNAGIQHRLASSYSGMAALYIKEKNYNMAEKYELLSLQHNTNEDNDRQKAISFLQLGEIYFNTNRPEKAIVHLKKGIPIFNSHRSVSDLIICYEFLFESYKKQNDYKQAFYYQSLYTQLNDSLRNQNNAEAMSAMQTRYEVDKKNTEIKFLQHEKEISELKLDTQNVQIAKQTNLIYFSISIVVLLVTIGILLYILNKRNQTRKNIEQEKIKLELEKKMLELEQKALQSQMNPHFIFNALNSIQAFITSKDILQAAGFLSKFAKLMRLILESSREQMIPLDKEIDMLEYYLQIQQLCYGQKFNFKIEVEENIDSEEIKVPPMLIQPYIENAIVHGVMHKETVGTIIVRFSMRDAFIHVEVEDDGVGREKAALLKKQLDGDFHKSVGLLITQERIEILNKETNKHILTNIVDQKNDEGFPMGTKAVILFPVTYS